MILEDVKRSLRITNSHFDSEVQDLIDASELDLQLSGISYVEVDQLIKRAITTYVKAHFGYDNADADRFNDSYVMLKQHLCLSGDYIELA